MLFGAFRWRYLQYIRRTIYAPMAPESRTRRARTRLDAPAVVLGVEERRCLDTILEHACSIHVPRAQRIGLHAVQERTPGADAARQLAPAWYACVDAQVQP